MFITGYSNSLLGLSGFQKSEKYIELFFKMICMNFNDIIMVMLKFIQWHPFLYIKLKIELNYFKSE